MNSWVRIDKLLTSKNASQVLRGLSILVLMVLIVVQQTLMFTMPMHDDEAVFLRVGRDLTKGQKLYVDTWDHKPPAIYLLAQFIVVMADHLHFDPLTLARVIIMLINFCSTAFLYLIIIRSHNKFFGIFLAGIFMLLMYWWHGGYFLAEPIVVGLFLSIWWWHEKSSHSHWESLLLGMLTGYLFWWKQMAVPLMIVIGLKVWQKQNMRSLLFFSLGVLLNVFILFLFLWIWSDIHTGLDAILWFNLLNYPPELLDITLRHLPQIAWPALGLIILAMVEVVRLRQIAVGLGMISVLPLLLTRPYHHYWLLFLPLLLLSVSRHAPANIRLFALIPVIISSSMHALWAITLLR